MRPVDRGTWPLNDDGNAVQYSEYSHARRELIKRMGEYCSYCEMQLDASLAVEHVQPKQPLGAIAVNAARALSWDNFLLACTNCNSTKGNEDVYLPDYLWPDRDNTFRAIRYASGGLVSAIPGIADVQASNLIKLVGLDKTPDTSTASDRRWLNRKEAWEIAERARDRLARCSSGDMKEQIIETAQAKGYWSIWMTVFENDPDMLLRLIEGFLGTSKQCFNFSNGDAVGRLGGQC